MLFESQSRAEIGPAPLVLCVCVCVRVHTRAPIGISRSNRDIYTVIHIQNLSVQTTDITAITTSTFKIIAFPHGIIQDIPQGAKEVVEFMV